MCFSRTDIGDVEGGLNPRGAQTGATGRRRQNRCLGDAFDYAGDQVQAAFAVRRSMCRDGAGRRYPDCSPTSAGVPVGAGEIACE